MPGFPLGAPAAAPSSPPTREVALLPAWTRRRRRLRRAVLRRRRPLAALALGLAVLAGLASLRDPAAATVAVPVAAHDLPAGAVLGPDDVVVVAFRPGTAPAGLVVDAAGRTLAGPLRSGEPVTDARLVGPGLAVGTGDDGTRATPVRLADAGAVGLLSPGDRVDLVVADPQGRAASVVAPDVEVLAVPQPSEATASELPGRVVVLALPSEEVTSVVQAAVGGFVTYAWTTR